jgi:DsbC/DsbD-like thiol-disulfide interchange protein
MISALDDWYQVGLQLDPRRVAHPASGRILSIVRRRTTEEVTVKKPAFRMATLALGTCALVFSTACQTIPEEAKVELDKPVDCSTAQQDIQILEKEKASVAKRFFDGVTAVYPAAAVMSILTKQEKAKYEVAIGHYNHQLTEKIREIKVTCGLE